MSSLQELWTIWSTNTIRAIGFDPPTWDFPTGGDKVNEFHSIPFHNLWPESFKDYRLKRPPTSMNSVYQTR